MADGQIQVTAVKCVGITGAECRSIGPFDGSRFIVLQLESVQCGHGLPLLAISLSEATSLRNWLDVAIAKETKLLAELKEG